MIIKMLNIVLVSHFRDANNQSKVLNLLSYNLVTSIYSPSYSRILMNTKVKTVIRYDSYRMSHTCDPTAWSGDGNVSIIAPFI